jgi:hypothetical protein
LLFNPKLSAVPGNQEVAVEMHAKLCSAVLSLIKQLNIEIGMAPLRLYPRSDYVHPGKGKFNVQTWEEEIKIMLGVADCVFVGKESTISLGGKIGPLLLQVRCIVE